MINKIIHGDCLDVMKDIPDKSVDLILTDPPYGINEANGKNHSRGLLAKSKEYTVKDWDNKIPEKEIFEEMFRVSKNQIIFGGNYFFEYLYNSPCWLVWHKEINGDFADCEIAWTSFKSAIRYFKWRWNGMLQENMKQKDIRIHPTQKPTGLFQNILQKYSKEGETVLDCFSGSGTTAIACIRTNRNYICIEKDKEYYDLSVERVKQELAQGRLF